MTPIPIEQPDFTSSVDLERLRKPIGRIRRNLETFIRALEAGDVRAPRGGFGWDAHGRLGWSIHDRDRDPAIDVAELADRFVVTVDLPADDLEALSVRVFAGSLRISGRQRAQPDDHVARGHTRRDRRFDRRVDLPKPVVVETADAIRHSGVLTIVLEKRQSPTHHRIEIE